MRNRLLYTLSFIIFVLIAIPVINAIKDDYGVMGIKYAHLYSTEMMSNEEHFKLKFLTAKGNKKYTNFIFGESQAQIIPTKAFRDSKEWYNISGMTFTPYEYIDTLEYLKKHGVKVKRICMLVQPISSFYSKQTTIEDKKRYFMLTGFPFKKSEKPKFYANYIFINPTNKPLKQYQVGLLYKINLFNSGSFDYKQKDNKKNDKSDKPVFPNSQYFFKTDWPNTEYFEEIRKIIRYCKLNDIEIKVFTSPDYIVFRNLIPEEKMDYFKKELAKVTDYYDFSNINEITTNYNNYCSYDHFNSDIASLIIKRIYYENKNTPPSIKGFGDYVPKVIIRKNTTPVNRFEEPVTLTTVFPANNYLQHLYCW